MVKTSTQDKLITRIQRLKKDRNAIILAHNYQVGEIQDVADFLGDSLELSRKAALTDAEVIVFCGVHFMAETAAILCPDQMVLLPDLAAGCGMSEMISTEEVRTLKAEHPDAVVVCYVNSSAAVKAESDICCTSSNAANVVQSIPKDREIIFIPDQYLGDYVTRKTGRKLILFNGYCPTHFRIMTADLDAAKTSHPEALVVAHPECTPAVSAMADQVLSTSGICMESNKTEKQEVIVATEVGILHRLKKENPDKEFIPACTWCDCAHMKVNNLEKLLWSLESLQYPITVPPSIAKRAKQAIDRMLEIGS
ncbi:MAG: quinolinate synthase NadA [Nitrospira sp.]|nr:quinolinate synthase NadA [Candidatus Manganitrophaceae bacterium]HIL34062.1 quinolinate synthase NadA [Candidatus Manganitrophaceae bacterium]